MLQSMTVHRSTKKKTAYWGILLPQISYHCSMYLFARRSLRISNPPPSIRYHPPFNPAFRITISLRRERYNRLDQRHPEGCCPEEFY